MTADSPAPILLVDNDGLARGTLRVALEAHGYAVVEAEDGASALRLMEALGEAPCLMVLDMNTATMSAWEFLTIVNCIAEKAIPVILVSPKAPHWETMARGVIAGWVAKPYELPRIVPLIDAHASRHCAVRQPS